MVVLLYRHIIEHHSEVGFCKIAIDIPTRRNLVESIFTAAVTIVISYVDVVLHIMFDKMFDSHCYASLYYSIPLL